jgi:hypothetical protein
MQLSYFHEEIMSQPTFSPKIYGIYLAIEKWRTNAIPKVEEMSALMK